MIVLSYFSRPAAPSLANHRHYARLRGYRHDWIDGSLMPPSVQSRSLYKYQMLMNVLGRAEPDALVLILSENAAIIEPTPLEALMEGRDRLLVRTASETLPQVDMQIWRNTPAVLETLESLFNKCRVGNELSTEAELFAGAESLSWSQKIAGVFPAMPACFDIDPLWSRDGTFAIQIENSAPTAACPQKMGVSPRFTDALIDYVNQRQAAQLPFFKFPEYDSEDRAERSAYNPGHSIALVTLYTPNAETFARIAEHNFRRYSERHGYTLYVHRDVPQELGIKASGNWFKPWLLDGYLQHHDWVFWLDADLLIADQERPLEPLLEGRDVVVAHDVGQWYFNSGVMGFRKTEKNFQALRRLMEKIAALDNKSELYASGGDQHFFIEALEHFGLVGKGVVLDQVAINTYWEYRRPDSFIVHYAGMWWDIRAMMMAHDDRLLSE